MTRVDAGSKPIKPNHDAIDIGAARDFDSKYSFGVSVGTGGFGTVRLATEKATGKVFACKTICKKLTEQGIAGKRQIRHIENVRREIAVLRRLRGTLNVAQFKQVFEDDDDIHIVMEYCSGGELWHRVGNKHYTERTVASFIRAVLRTLSQCHSHRILHRDIKPGNFMLLNDNYRAPLKAIDFGLAVFYDPADLPRTDLGLEGTPWFMAPEIMSSEVYPSSDVWAAGVMTYQLLSGQMPFDDKRKPHSPALSVIWQAILTQQPSFTGKAWADISEPAKAFVKRLLDKDPKARPSAKEALQDPWLQGNSTERNQGKPLDATVVQRIQRYAQTNVLKRTIFELIAEEILKTMSHQVQATPDHSTHHNDAMDTEPSSLGSQPLLGGSPVEAPNPSWAPLMGAGRKRSLTQELKESSTAAVNIPNKLGTSAHGGLEYHRAFGLPASAGAGGNMSVHEAGYFRMIKTAVEAAKLRRSRSVHGAQHYLNAASRGKHANEREEHRKAARIALDTSAHAGSQYYDYMRNNDDQEELASPAAGGQQGNFFKPTPFDRASSVNLGSLSVENQSALFHQNLPPKLRPDLDLRQQPASSDAELVSQAASPSEAGKRGQSQYLQFLRRSSLDSTIPISRSDLAQGSGRASLDSGSPDLRADIAQVRGRESLHAAPFKSSKPTSATAVGAGNATAATAVGAGNATAATAVGATYGPKLERRSSSRVYFVPAHAAEADDHAASQSVQEAASHREQMLHRLDLPAQQRQQAADKAVQAQHPQQAQQQASGIAQKERQQPGRSQQAQQAQQANLKAQQAQRAQQAEPQAQQAQHAQQVEQQGPDAHEQSQERPAVRRSLTFQEMLREQLKAHSHQASPEEQGMSPDPSTHNPTPHSTPPRSNRRAHVTFEDMLRQQLGRQPDSSKPSTERQQASQHRQGSYQEMLRQQSYGAAPVSLSEGRGVDGNGPQPEAGTSQAAEDGQAVAVDRQLEDAAAAQQSSTMTHHNSMAEITPGGLRLYDAQGSCSIVPLEELRQMMRKLSFSRDKEGISPEQLAEGLKGLGYELAKSELGVLMDQISLDQHGQVAKPAFLASQVDWQDLQQNFKDQWLDCARAAFASMDSAEKGRISSSQLINLLSTKLPADEVEHAVEDALLEAGCGDMEDLDFNGFLKLMRVNSMDSLDSLDQYDSRLNSSSNLQGLDSIASSHGGQDGHQQLASVPE